MNKGEAKEYLVLEDRLLNEIARLNKLVWDDDKKLFKTSLGEYLNWDDMVCYQISINIPSGVINQILFFGDGTIEFQYKDDEEPINWSDLKKEELVTIINTLTTL